MKTRLSLIAKKNLEILLPTLSALLLILTTYPFNLWPLAFVALTPFFYFVYRTRWRHTTLFWGIFLVSFLPILSAAYWNLSGFTLTPEAHLFQTVMHLLPLPLALFCGIITGGIGVLAIKGIVFLRKSHELTPLYLALALPLFSALIEISVTMVSGFFSRGYDFSTLAFSVHTLPPLVSLAAIGGIHLVSLVILAINAIIAITFYTLFQHEDLPLKTRLLNCVPIAAYTLGVVIFFSAGVFAYDYYLHHDQPTSTISVALIQNADQWSGAFGSFDAVGTFQYQKLEDLIALAGQSSPDIIIYPYALADFTLSASSTVVSLDRDTAPLSSVTAWVAKTVPHATFVAWDTTNDAETLHDVAHVWQNGRLHASYVKEVVFPYMDYTPQWAKERGFYTTRRDITGAIQQQSPIPLDDVRLGSAICSEITERDLVRENAQGANIFLSVGSNAMFANKMTDQFTLASAQFRAAENNLPVIRADRSGPSAIIDPHGTITSQMYSGQDGVLSGLITFEKYPRTTLYQITGDWLLIGICLLGLLLLIVI